MTTQEIKGVDLKLRLMALAQEWWEWEQKNEQKGGAVKWLRNDQTGQTLIFTRGEYSHYLTKHVDALNQEDREWTY